MTKKYLSVLLTLAILCTIPFLGNAIEGTLSSDVSADFERIPIEDMKINGDDIFPEVYIRNTMTLEDDFTDDTVLVLLTKKRSWEQYEFTPEDFPEVFGAVMVCLPGQTA